jgi:hypothetical protein
LVSVDPHVHGPLVQVGPQVQDGPQVQSGLLQLVSDLDFMP